MSTPWFHESDRDETCDPDSVLEWATLHHLPPPQGSSQPRYGVGSVFEPTSMLPLSATQEYRHLEEMDQDAALVRSSDRNQALELSQNNSLFYPIPPSNPPGQGDPLPGAAIPVFNPINTELTAWPQLEDFDVNDLLNDPAIAAALDPFYSTWPALGCNANMSVEASNSYMHYTDHLDRNSLESVATAPPRQIAKRERRVRKDLWEPWTDVLKYLLLDQAHTYEEAAFEMSVLHNFTRVAHAYEKRAAKLGIKKNKVGGQANRRRLAVAFLRNLNRSSILKLIWSGFEPRLTRGVFDLKYKNHYQMFHAIDGLVKGLFAAGEGKSWRGGSLYFNPPTGYDSQADVGFTMWQSISQQCSSLSRLAVMNKYRQMDYALDQMSTQLNAVTEYTKADPNFLAHAWNMFLSLIYLSIPGKNQTGNNSFFLRYLLREIQKRFDKSLGSHHSLVLFLSRLLDIVCEPLEIIHKTLGLAYWKLIDMLRSTVGPNDMIVLRLEVHLSKNWKGMFVVDMQKVSSRYEAELSEMARRGMDATDDYISLLHDYIVAISNGKDNTPGVILKLEDLRQRACNLCSKRPRLVLDSTCRAYIFATEMISSHYLELKTAFRGARVRRPKMAQRPSWRRKSQIIIEEPNRDISYIYVQEAIDLLLSGDKDCQVQALLLIRRMTGWLKSYKPDTEISKTAAGPERVAYRKDKEKEILSLFGGTYSGRTGQSRRSFRESFAHRIKFGEDSTG